jgi:hypothetical protein
MTRWMFAVVGVAAALALGIQPALAGGPLADLHVKKVGKPYKGDGVLNLTGDQQTVKTLAFSGQAAKFKARVENAGDSPDTVFLRGDGSNANFKVRYRDHLGNNITQAMLAEMASFTLDDGEVSEPVRILVTPRPSAPLGAMKTVRVTSSFAGIDHDRVKVKVENGLPGE